MLFFQMSLQNAALAQDLFLLCNGATNIKSVNNKDQTIQDDWSQWNMELWLSAGEYFMATKTDGHTYVSDGTVEVTPTRYILLSNATNPLGDYSETYIDRITGHYHSFAVIDDTLLTSVKSSAVCQTSDAPKPKF
jgi:hypothetical protein